MREKNKYSDPLEDIAMPNQAKTRTTATKEQRNLYPIEDYVSSRRHNGALHVHTLDSVVAPKRRSMRLSRDVLGHILLHFWRRRRGGAKDATHAVCLAGPLSKVDEAHATNDGKPSLLLEGVNGKLATSSSLNKSAFAR